MYRVLAVVCLAVVVAGRDNYFERYGFNKIMLGCFGPYAYKEQIAAIVAAEEQCRGETFSMADMPLDQGPDATPAQAQGRDLQQADSESEEGEGSGKSLYPLPPVYKHGVGVGVGVGVPHVGVHPHKVAGHAYGYKPASYGGLYQQAYPLLHHLVDAGLIGEASRLEQRLAHLDSAVGNFTCTLQRLGLVDDNLEILYNNVFNSIYSSVFDPYLRQDLLAGIYQCSYLLQCLPEDRVGSAFPYKLQRLLAFHRCERKARLTACLKQDLKRNIQNFDLTVLPDDGGRTGELEKLLTIIVGAEATEDLEFY